LTKAYIKNRFDHTVVTAISPYPFSIKEQMLVTLQSTFKSAVTYPLCLCLSLPVFLYMIVLEKEQKIIEDMKCNGLQMRNYWAVNFGFNFCYYMLTVAVFIFLGRFVFGMHLLIDTSIYILVVFLSIWGWIQVFLAYFYSVFFSKSTSAAAFGYGMALYMQIIAITLLSALYLPPADMPVYLHFYPSFTFTRIFFLLSV
jgi:hypothetical protein